MTRSRKPLMVCISLSVNPDRCLTRITQTEIKLNVSGFRISEVLPCHCPEPLSFLPSAQSRPNEREQSDLLMSSTGEATSSDSNIQSIVDALADYARTTGIDLSKNQFAAAFEQSTSPEAILQLLQGREKAFKEYRDGDRRLISYLTPAVNVLQAFSGILGEAVNLVSHTTYLLSFFNVILPDPVPTRQRIVRWNRYTP